MHKFTEKIKNLLKRFNFKIEHIDSWYKRKENSIAEIEADELKFIKNISNYSMCTPANHWAIIQSLKHIKKNNIEGDIVECGVWKGGNLILFKKILNKIGINRKIYAFDTFEGMPVPGQNDFDLKNNNANAVYGKYRQKDIKWCYSSLEEVRQNILKTDLELNNNFKFIKGKVEETLKENKNLPDKISLLRLDTDFYESTMIELEILFPRLQKGGILIIDDYGHWKGSKLAVDEYFNLEKNFYFMHRIDYASRLLIK
jgi:O-methyltransferase